MSEDDDQFQAWLMDMGDAIERLMNSLPAEISRKMDFTAESLSPVEHFCLARYPSATEAKELSEAKTIDSIARYVGQVFRKNLGGKWFIDFSDPKNAFYGLPQLSGMTGQDTQICPLSLVIASLDRRTGKFLRTVYESHLET
ncbi:hypothetical protein [Pelomonas sp. KK5]|uniref:hypothetical protein n=1 Tax=Pelomonas sp. KK5 TaxID=1855730 RepID=UPI00097C9540|nr:hypothetical protein [Pelomonas sp. KK5]